MLLHFSPFMIIGNLIFNVFMSLLEPFSTVILLRFVINAVSENGGALKVFYAVLVFAVIAAVVTFLSAMFTNTYLPKQKEKFTSYLLKELFEKAVECDLKSYDDPDFYNSLTLSVSSIEEKFLGIVDTITIIVGRLANLICVLAVFLQINSMIFCVLFISLFIVTTLSKKIADLNYRRSVEMMPLLRKEKYYSDCFRLNEYAKEMRLGNICEYLKKLYQKNNEDTIQLEKKYASKIWIRSLLQTCISNTVFLNGILLLYLIYQCVVEKKITIGDFTAVFNGIQTAMSALIYLTATAPAQLREKAQYIEKYKEFMNTQSEVVSGKRSLISGQIICFENVSFAYNTKNVLENINLKINIGEKIALVGYNGSGKTTLIKLLMRFYDPTEGKITLDGVDIRDLDLLEYRKKFTSVFQDYQLYAVKLGENLSLSKSFDSDLSWKCLEKSGFIESFKPEKDILYDEIGREFTEGLRMSQGQSQQISIGRSYYYANKISILDEPAASLDPFLEEQLNNQLFLSTESHTVIVVSHRLSSTVLADRIILLHDGKVSEQGKHEELMKLNGEYAEFFKLQSEDYLNSLKKYC